jgi:hypothetical protein
MEEITLKPNKKEVAPKVNFKQLFDAKLESIAPLSEQDSEWESEGFQDLGIKKIKRKVPAVIIRFSGDKKPLQLWATDPKNTTSVNYIHDDVREELKKFLETSNLNPEISSNASSAYVIQDDEDKLYLFFDGVVAEGRKSDVEFGYEFGSSHIKKYEELMKRYGIEKMMGQFHETKTEGDTTSYGWKMENILDKDIIGRIRENEYLVTFAQKYQMTNNQFMRFRLRAIAGREATLRDKEATKRGVSYLIDLDDLAKEIIAQDKEEGHL